MFANKEADWTQAKWRRKGETKGPKPQIKKEERGTCTGGSTPFAGMA